MATNNFYTVKTIKMSKLYRYNDNGEFKQTERQKAITDIIRKSSKLTMGQNIEVDLQQLQKTTDPVEVDEFDTVDHNGNKVKSRYNIFNVVNDINKNAIINELEQLNTLLTDRQIKAYDNKLGQFCIKVVKCEGHRIHNLLVYDKKSQTVQEFTSTLDESIKTTITKAKHARPMKDEDIDNFREKFSELNISYLPQIEVHKKSKSA